MGTSEFTRLAKFLNFRRSFPSPVTSLVHIPSFSYQDIDNTGAKVQLWSIAGLFEAATRVFSFSKGPSMDSPDSSIAHFNELLQSHLIFVAGSNVRVQREFYRPESPKFPLYIRTTVHGLGSTSLSLLAELFHEGTDKLYASSNIAMVVVSRETRRPTRLPEWWLQKYSGLIKGDRVKPYVFEEPRGQTYSSPFNLRNSETDLYLHANWATYIQHCCDNLYAGIIANKFPGLGKGHWESGFRDVEMNIKAESNIGDELTVESWENPSVRDSACCRVMKGSDVCYNARFSFYSDDMKNKL